MAINFSLKHEFENLKLRQSHLEEALIDAEEDLDNTKNESKESMAKHHNIIDTLETKIKVFQNEKAKICAEGCKVGSP